MHLTKLLKVWRPFVFVTFIEKERRWVFGSFESWFSFLLHSKVRDSMYSLVIPDVNCIQGTYEKYQM